MYLKFEFQTVNDYSIACHIQPMQLQELSNPISPLTLLNWFERKIKDFSFYRFKVRELIADGPNVIHPIKPSKVTIKNKSLNVFSCLSVDENGQGVDWQIIYTNGKFVHDDTLIALYGGLIEFNKDDFKRSIQSEIETLIALQDATNK